MRVYTGRGDDGDTDLADQTRVPKTHARIEAYGTVDELNAAVGRARPTGLDDVDDDLQTVQHHLFTVQSQLATPDPGADDPTLDPGAVGELEARIDDYEAELPPLDSFVLPGGTDAASDLHVARATCRRAERRVVALDADAGVADAVLAYLNRLSDLLFTQARLANHRAGVDDEEPAY